MHVVVVGASLAGLRSAEALRRGGHTGPITVVGSENHPPYDRPPLSKQLLTGRVDPDATALGPTGDLGVDWLLGVTATGVDLDRRRVRLDGAGELGFDALVIATGSEARTLALLADRPGVHLLRTLDDALALRQALLSGSPRVLVVGAGVIGLEVASSARSLGLQVTVVEMADAPLTRVVGDRLAPAVTGLHRDHGVDLRLGVTIEAVEGTGAVETVRLAGGSSVAADLVVVGVGAAPATAWLEGSGVDLADGVLCDSRDRKSVV